MNESQLLEALRQAMTPKESGEGMRVDELVKATGASQNAIRKWIRNGLEAGTITRSRRLIVGIDGRNVSVSGYSLK